MTKIEWDRKKTTFSNIEIGHFFVVGDYLYLKIEPEENDLGYNAILIKDEDEFSDNDFYEVFKPDDIINPANVKIEVKLL